MITIEKNNCNSCKRCNGLIVIERDFAFPLESGMTQERCVNCGAIVYSPIPEQTNCKYMKHMRFKRKHSLLTTRRSYEIE